MHFPVLHGQDGFPTGWLASDWTPDPGVILAAFAIAAGYVAWTGALNRRRPDVEQRPVSTAQRAMFLAGCLAFLIVLSPPLDDWGDNFLLTAHMVQHLGLMFIVAPLWLAGTPAWLLEPLTRNPVVNRIGYELTRPATAFAISNALLILWHIPGAYDAALQSDLIHAIQHGSFLAAALLAWWPVLGPLPEWPRLSPAPAQCFYLFLYGIPGGILGAFITLADAPLYDFYGTAPRLLNIGVDIDQQIAGFLMWFGVSLIYLAWITVLFLRWAERQEADELRPNRAPVSPPHSQPGARA